jgi:hypothetical protein
MSNTPASSPTENSKLFFPREAMTGSLGDFARLMANGTEVPEEFYFAAGLTFFGATCGQSLTLNAQLKSEPRLFTVLLGESADVKKSTAFRTTLEFFDTVWKGMPAILPKPSPCYGVGSAEGLANSLQKNPGGVVLCYDELQALIAKSKIDSSTLLPMVASLFEQTKYENATKNQTLKVEDARLSLIGCCTTDTYANMWTKDAIAIGLPNRLFVVWAGRKRRVSWPEPRDPLKIEAVRLRIIEQLGKLPKKLDMTAEAKELWDRWYDRLPSSMHAKRLDTMGFRLLGLIALTADKDVIDVATVETVTSILNYELTVRTVTDPIDADGMVAQLEGSIRRQLKTHGCLSERDLRNKTSADKKGVWAFRAAITNLTLVKDIFRRQDGKYVLTDEVSEQTSDGPPKSSKSSGMLELAPVSSP